MHLFIRELHGSACRSCALHAVGVDCVFSCLSWFNTSIREEFNHKRHGPITDSKRDSSGTSLMKDGESRLERSEQAQKSPVNRLSGAVLRCWNA
jgi:hypothetical protein